MAALKAILLVLMDMKYSILCSVIFLVLGIVLFNLLTYLVAIPGNKKIDNLFIDEKEKQEHIKEKKRAKKTYIIVLTAIALIIFLITAAPYFTI